MPLTKIELGFDKKRILLQPEHLPGNALGALNQPNEDKHVKDGFPDVLPTHGNGGEGRVHGGTDSRHKSGEY